MKIALPFLEHTRNIPWFLGRHAFVASIVLILFAVLLNALLFFLTVVAPQQGETSGLSVTKFQEENFQRVLGEWETKNLQFQNPKETRDIFSPNK